MTLGEKIKEFLKEIDLLSLALALSISILPWSIWLNSISIIIISVGLIIYTLMKKKRLIIRLKPFLITSVFFWVSITWLTITSDMREGGKYVEHGLSSLIFPILFSVVNNHYRININYIFLLFLGSCVLKYLLFVIGIIEIELIFILEYWKEIFIQVNQLFKLRAMHPSYFSMYLGFCSLISYHYYCIVNKKRNKYFFLFLLILTFAFNLSLMAKMPLIASIISLFVAFIISLFKSFKEKTRTVIVVSFLCISFLCALYIKNVPNSFIQEINNYYKLINGDNIEDTYDYNQYGIDSSINSWKKTNRVYIWRSSIDVIKEEKKLLLGVGTGDIKKNLKAKYLKNDFKYLATNNTNTHNQYLDYIIRYGIVGLILIIAAFCLYLKKANEKQNYLYMMFLLLICLSMLTENILNRQYGIVFFFFFNSFFFLISKRKTDMRMQ
ncbi:O-antigen ligase family protein [Aquimarina hainanensis]|uniref:O-antigen ligase family protein n=1 Tax=Aquimarina hainanensis TaxID=1578017 RepID=UPI00361D8753